jgi:hypothetical protein
MSFPVTTICGDVSASSPRRRLLVVRCGIDQVAHSAEGKISGRASLFSFKGDELVPTRMTAKCNPSGEINASIPPAWIFG